VFKPYQIIDNDSDTDIDLVDSYVTKDEALLNRDRLNRVYTEGLITGRL